jgi:hypothetical protein
MDYAVVPIIAAGTGVGNGAAFGHSLENGVLGKWTDAVRYRAASFRESYISGVGFKSAMKNGILLLRCSVEDCRDSWVLSPSPSQALVP